MAHVCESRMAEGSRRLLRFLGRGWVSHASGDREAALRSFVAAKIALADLARAVSECVSGRRVGAGPAYDMVAPAAVELLELERSIEGRPWWEPYGPGGVRATLKGWRGQRLRRVGGRRWRTV